MSGFHAVVLAAGQGTRMKSALPKVLHPLAGLPLVSHVMRAAFQAGASECSLVVGPESEGQFAAVLENPALPAKLFVQSERLGTAHAVLAARNAFTESNPAIVLYGDTPLITSARIEQVLRALNSGADVVVLGFVTETPAGYGRLVTGNGSELLAIREEKDATDEERLITLCNSGIMAFRAGLLPSLLDGIGNENKAGEYYLTDAVAIARERHLSVAYEIADEDEVRGVNNRAQLSEAEGVIQTRLRKNAMDGGATLLAPGAVTLCHDTVIGQDVLIEPNVFFGPGVTIENGVTIKGFCHIEGAHIEEGAVVGPFARLRPNTRIGAGARVGNFVEIKEATLGAEVKVNHLTYIGDAEVGVNANIGAGTITCNYDGFRKHRIEIGADAFVGSNSSLVAPVRVGEGAYIGSGSVITKDVPPGALAVSRSPQTNHDQWAARQKARMSGARNTAKPAESAAKPGKDDPS